MSAQGKALRAAGSKAREWKERRDEIIRAWHREGGTFREIAEAAGLSIGAVQGIVSK